MGRRVSPASRPFPAMPNGESKNGVKIRRQNFQRGKGLREIGIPAKSPADFYSQQDVMRNRSTL
jgi:hypothetical protein